jgi:hypothetical protein
MKRFHRTMLCRFGCSAALATACAALPLKAVADEFMYPAGVACPGFPLKVEYAPDASHLLNREFYDKNGNFIRFLQAGQNFPITFTNLATGATYRTKPEGTVLSVTPNPDGSETWVMTGHTVITWSVSDPPDSASAPSTVRYVGRLVVRVSNGNVLSVPQFKGKQTDICAALS